MGTRGGAAVSSSAAERSSERVRLKVLYDFEYDTRGKRVRIVKDERLLLLNRTNEDWWQVVRPADLQSNLYVPEQSTFYVPTGYVAELQEEALSETTRFYVDKDKMFKSSSTTGEQATSTAAASGQQQQHSSTQEGNKEEPRKAHDSFKGVFRKLSGNLGSGAGDSNKGTKPVKPPKIIKNLRKNSVDSSEDVKLQSSKSSLVPAKHKDTWESSAFGMCFGRQNVDAQVLNPFQEELENALSNRVTHKRTILDTKLGIGKHVDQVSDEREKPLTKFENIQDKWVKASAQVLKKPDNIQKSDNFQFVPLSKIKEDAQKRRSASPNLIEKSVVSNNVNSVVKRLSETEKLYSVVDKIPKKPVQLTDQKVDVPKPSTDIPKPVADTVKPVVAAASNPPVTTNDKTVTQESPSKDIDRLLINDKRKMWAIETLMSELMQTSSNSKLVASAENSETGISGPNQLAQELHDMTVSRQNAEIQVNLLDNNDDDNTKENEQLNLDTTKCRVESYKKKVFDFPPHANTLKAPRSPTARSPKLLDEYNEANILNDNDRAREAQDVPATAVELLNYKESPSYSNISLRIKREKVPSKLKMPTKDYREELQLTPSLEKLASEIKFLPASTNSSEFENDKHSPDMDFPTTTLSQDSLRLYKRRSKSDGALNKRDPRRRDSVDSQQNNNNNNNNNNSSSGSVNHTEIFKAKDQPHSERKYTQHETHQHQSMRRHNETPEYYRPERLNQTARYKLNRKSRSLGDLDCSEMDENKEVEEEDGSSSTCDALESRRRYKPVPKLRSKESLRRIKPTAPVVTPTASSERLATRPVPAKRRVQQAVQLTTPQQQQQQPSQPCDSSYDDLSEIDIERSTAIGFKTLLRTSDSGSEEYLQYKTFPSTTKTLQQQQLSPYSVEQQSKISRSDSNVNNLSRSISDEAILSSATSCSSASPSRILDGSVENLVDLPAGWTQSYDKLANRVCFVNDRGDKWFSSNDAEGKIYFFEENSNESSWALPPVVNHNRIRTISNGDWPQLFDGNMFILKEGLINKTKITAENGKKLRKTWSTSYAVLTEVFLLFFKDAKTFAEMKMDQSAAAKPDISVDLNGAFIESAEKLSNRKNVYLINTMMGLQVLIQWDNPTVTTEWYREIHDAIQRLPFSRG
ncbi:hypothetical protein TSAR_003130 [Trichomalopsis sarcophagae]|uniref:SH3 domain-containing protein n=1 Tax=Trichomalopsis sarcophagae TaxID=543379 RepID=A0A232F772_9HYME|nr:hypothetical protein TSAR_003130 [Trichomalopsis sarcophagae]